MNTATRSYTLRRRAEAQDETRARIVRATVALHEELGPAQTTISAIAERAGVQRLTVYRHFPDDVALFAACTSRWFEDNPPPDPAAWESIAQPAERLRAALLALFSYYRRTARMWEVSYRDLAVVPALRAPMQGFERYLQRVQRGVGAAWGERGRAPAVKALISHFVRYSSWATLVQQGRLSNGEGAQVAAQAIEAALRQRA